MCSESFDSQTSLYSHCARRHFRDHVLTKYGRPGHCSICQTDLTSEEVILDHFGVEHGLVERLLEQHSNQMVRIKLTQNSDTATKERELLSCSRCSAAYPYRSNLYVHYANVHFKQEIYGQYGWQIYYQHCKQCNKSFSGAKGAIGHFGVAHGMVEACLEPQFHIAKSTTLIRNHQ